MKARKLILSLHVNDMSMKLTTALNNAPSLSDVVGVALDVWQGEEEDVLPFGLVTDMDDLAVHRDRRGRRQRPTRHLGQGLHQGHEDAAHLG